LGQARNRVRSDRLAGKDAERNNADNPEQSTPPPPTARWLRAHPGRFTTTFRALGAAHCPSFCGTDPPARAASPFGNDCQPIEIARGVFGLFSKCALKWLNNQADFDSAIRRFDPSRPSQPVLRLTTVCNLRLTGAEIRAFRVFDFVSRLQISQTRERNCRKSPALSAEIADGGPMKVARRTPGPASANLPWRKPREVWRGDASDAMGI